MSIAIDDKFNGRKLYLSDSNFLCCEKSLTTRLMWRAHAKNNVYGYGIILAKGL